MSHSTSRPSGSRLGLHLTRVVALSAASLLLLSACAVNRSGSSSSGATASALTDTGKQVAQVTVALPGSLSNLYPGQEAGILNYNVAALTQEGLVALNDKGEIVPALAEKWSQTDPTTYVYTLRPDAKFQNGDPVTAEDVKFSLDQAKDAKLSPGISGYLAGVSSIAVTGSNEVTVKLAAPDAAFPKLLSVAGAAFITEKSFWQSHKGKIGTSSSLLLGTGPYKVTSFTPDSGVTLERVDTWWGGVPKVKKIVIKFIPDENTRYLAAQSGDVDLAFNVPLAQTKQWESLKGFRVDYKNDLSYVGLNFDTKVKPFNDPLVRKAIAYSVDKNAIVKSLLRGHAEAATSIATPESIGGSYSPAEARTLLATVPHTQFDAAKAKAALQASGSPNGFKAEITYPATGPQLGLAAQALSQNLKTIGITLTVKEVPIEQWLASLGDGKHGVGFMWYFSTTGDPAEVPSFLLGADNISHYKNPTITSLLAQAGAETDAKQRIALLLKVETVQANDFVNVPLWWGQSATAFSKTLGLKDYSAYSFVTSWGASLFRGQ